MMYGGGGPMQMPLPATMPGPFVGVGPMGPMQMPLGAVPLGGMGPGPGITHGRGPPGGPGGGVADLPSTVPGVTGDGRRAAVQATRKKTAAGQEQRHEMRERMRYIMFEIDESNGHFISNRSAQQPFQFLDVCCCPGGFSSYSLTAGPAPRKGIGLSLPPELGGHLPAMDKESDTYYMHFVDVTTVAAGVRVADMGVGVPGCPQPALRLNAPLSEPPSGRCQLVILDGSFLGGKDWIHKETSLTDAENPAFNVYCTNAAAHKALLVAQLIVMANNLAAGGLLVLRLNMFPDMFTIGVLGLLRQVFLGDVCSYKPRSCHVHVGSYYLVCTNFDPKRAQSMQWVLRWNDCLQRLRAKGAAPRFVPFDGFYLETAAGMQTVWTRAMYAYHVHLWRFLKLVEVAMEEKSILDRRVQHRSRLGRFTNSCGRIFAGVPCSGRCNSAHTFDELHPFVQKAFREPRGFLFMPGSLALVTAPLVQYDPLPETLLELRQQAHMQSVLQAQAAADSQRTALHAASAAASAGGPGSGGNVLGHVGSYNDAVQLGMAGEWVHGLMRDARDTDEAGEDALQLFMRGADDPNVVLEGGFEDPEPEPGSVQHPGPQQQHQQDQQERQHQKQPGFGAGRGPGGATVAGMSGAGAAAQPPASPLGSVAEEASSAVSGAAARGGGGGGGGDGAATGGGDAASLEAEWDFTTTAETSAAGGGRAGGIRPELLRMSGYQPRLGLLAIEVEDDETLEAMCDYPVCTGMERDRPRRA